MAAGRWTPGLVADYRPPSMTTEVFCEFTVEASHHLPRVPAGHPCAPLHDHSYRIAIHVVGPVDEELGWVMDYATVQSAFEPLRRQLDNRTLNEIEGLENPTSEILARWIWTRLEPKLLGLSKVVVQENTTTGSVYTKDRGER